MGNLISVIEASRGAGAQVRDCKRHWLWVRFPIDEEKYLFKFIFSFLCPGNDAKRGIEFRHLTRGIRWKIGNRVH